MAFFRSKAKKASGVELFEKAACEHRLSQSLASKFRAVVKVAKLLPLLLEDDRIACEYMETDHSSGLPNGYKLLTGGYFRFYNPEEGMIYLSPFKRSMQLGLATVFRKSKFQYLKWRVESISKLYIKNSAEERISAILQAEIKRPASASSAEAIPMAGGSRLARATSGNSLPTIGSRGSAQSPSNFTIAVHPPPGTPKN